jgi:hypothetical protein
MSLGQSRGVWYHGGVWPNGGSWIVQSRAPGEDMQKRERDIVTISVNKRVTCDTCPNESGI